MEWSEEQAAEAERKVQENSTQRVCQEKQGAPRWTLSGIDSLRTAGGPESLCYWSDTELWDRTRRGGVGQGWERAVP